MENKELFKDIPNLEKFFKNLEQKIRSFHRYRWNEYTTRENLTQKRDELLKIANNLSELDLYILFYISHLKNLKKYSAFKLLQKVYRTQCALCNTLPKTDDLFDPVLIGQVQEQRPRSVK